MEFEIKNPNKSIDSTDFQEKTGASFFCLDEKFYVGGVANVEEAEKLIASYVYVKPKDPTIVEKLASVGLSIEELKAALGGN
jgi:hypothetical protein